MEKWDLGDDLESSSTACSEYGGLLKEAAPRRKSKPHWLLPYPRLLAEVVLVIILVGLLGSRRSTSRRDSTQPTYGPAIPRKPVKLGNSAGFGPDIEYYNHEMLWNNTEMSRIHYEWHKLFPVGRGYVHADASDDFEILLPPFSMDNALEKGDHYEGHIMAVFHQLHCLSILATSLGTSQEEWKAMAEDMVEHRTHCVEYLRQSILCNGDTTLEGETGAFSPSTGWGQTHMCVDYDALMSWANDRAIWNLDDKLLTESFNFKDLAKNGSNYG